MSEPKVQFNEKDLHPISTNIPLTKEEIMRMKTAWAKSYRVDESFVKLEFERLRRPPIPPEIEDPMNPSDPQWETHVKMWISIRGGLNPDGTVNLAQEWRRVYSIKIMPPQEIQDKAEQLRRQNPLLSGTPLNTISIVREARPVRKDIPRTRAYIQ